jgi:hypothetical protein
MFGPNGNPRVDRLFAIMGELQRKERVNVELQLYPC